ncbi:hypothetical protein GOBAR_DD24047 [Gossypium barbadense]|nr:hypothetical protein GOBAR_DD24047 [Gossypium barbadense]
MARCTTKKARLREHDPPDEDDLLPDQSVIGTFSFKDTLLQAGTNNEEKPVEKEEDDIVVQEGIPSLKIPFIMEMSDGIPSLKFLERVHSLIQNSDYKVFRSED